MTGSARLVAAAKTWVTSVWFLPTLAMLVSGFWNIGGPVLWQDELVSLDVARRSVPEIIELLRSVDLVHGAYYLFMHFWIGVFGSSPLALRAPTALASAGTVACITLIANRLFSRWAAILAGLVMVVIPASVRFAQEVRSNAFVVFAAALSTLLLLRALERPTWRRWALYSGSLLAILGLNIVAMSIVVGHAAAVLCRPESRTRRHLLGFICSGLAVGLIGIPFITVTLRQSARQIHWIKHSPALQVWQETYLSAWVPWVMLGLAVLAWFVSRRSALFVTLVALLPVLVVWLASFDLNFFYPRYLIFALPAWAVLAGAGLTLVKWRPAVAAGLVVLLVAALPGQRRMRGDLSHAWYNYPAVQEQWSLDYRAAAEVITRGYQPGDAAAYSRYWWWFMQDVAIPYYSPDTVRLRDVFVQKPAAQIGNLWPVDCADAVACEIPERRVWLVLPFNTTKPLDFYSEPQRAALAGYELVSVEHPTGMTVVLAVRSSTPR